MARMRTDTSSHCAYLTQIWASVLPVGPSGQTLNSSFKSRETPEYKQELGLAIINIARVVPDGLLVFFPSYSVLTGCVEAWQAGSPSVWCASLVRKTRHAWLTLRVYFFRVYFSQGAPLSHQAPGRRAARVVGISGCSRGFREQTRRCDPRCSE